MPLKHVKHFISLFIPFYYDNIIFGVGESTMHTLKLAVHMHFKAAFGSPPFMHLFDSRSKMNAKT